MVAGSTDWSVKRIACRRRRRRRAARTRSARRRSSSSPASSGTTTRCAAARSSPRSTRTASAPPFESWRPRGLVAAGVEVMLQRPRRGSVLLRLTPTLRSRSGGRPRTRCHGDDARPREAALAEVDETARARATCRDTPRRPLAVLSPGAFEELCSSRGRGRSGALCGYTNEKKTR